jgi:hypothetical protein
MRGDVTAGYVIHDVERLRAPMQKVADFILKAAGVKKPTEVQPINRAARGRNSNVVSEPLGPGIRSVGTVSDPSPLL